MVKHGRVCYPSFYNFTKRHKAIGWKKMIEKCKSSAKFREEFAARRRALVRGEDKYERKASEKKGSVAQKTKKFEERFDELWFYSLEAYLKLVKAPPMEKLSQKCKWIRDNCDQKVIKNRAGEYGVEESQKPQAAAYKVRRGVGEEDELREVVTFSDSEDARDAWDEAVQEEDIAAAVAADAVLREASASPERPPLVSQAPEVPTTPPTARQRSRSPPARSSAARSSSMGPVNSSRVGFGCPTPRLVTKPGASKRRASPSPEGPEPSADAADDVDTQPGSELDAESRGATQLEKKQDHFGALEDEELRQTARVRARAGERVPGADRRVHVGIEIQWPLHHGLGTATASCELPHC